MYDESSINDPDGDVLIDSPHRGDIRCRRLTIGRNGSVFGNVVAEEARVAGRFDGTMYATRFFTAAGSKVFGAVNADLVSIKPGSTVRAYIGPEFPISSGPKLSESTEEAILRGIEQAADEIVRAAAPVATEKSAVDMTSAAAAAQDAQTPAKRAVAAAAAVAADRGAATRKALPSLV